MTKDAQTNRTSFAFTAQNERATAIGLVAEDYPDSAISVELVPIRNDTDMTYALSQVIMRMHFPWSNLYDEDRGRVTQRYMQLAEAKDSSMVVLEVPGGAEDFDWTGFYEKVDAYL
ncbi:MAG TPA: hypothetical protein VN554_02615 [Verrucomicrobiae bacterium]|nr:hypothetical protein [Verrucomicrobiae bacterium]